MPRSTPASETSVPAVNRCVLRVTQSTIVLAADMLCRSRSDFMIDASKKAAESAILDQRFISVSPEIDSEFLSMLDRPAEANEQLRRTMQTPAPWESQ